MREREKREETRKENREKAGEWRCRVKQSNQNSRGFVSFVGVAKAKRLAIKKLLLNWEKNWYFFPDNNGTLSYIT